MAIVKLGSDRYQVKVIGSDGKWTTKVLPTLKDARVYEAELREQKYSGTIVASAVRKMTLDEYSERWFEDCRQKASPGWKRCQMQFYKDYVSPHLGSTKLSLIKTPMVARVLNAMVELGKSDQTNLHVYNLMRKMFIDAIEFYQYVSFNPVIRRLKPSLPVKQAPHLKLNQIVSLLKHVKEKEYGLAIWLQLYLGLRVNEVMALKWLEVDLANGILHIRSGFSRKDAWVLKSKERGMKAYPKGRKHHSVAIPPELLEMLNETRVEAKSEFVIPSPFTGEMLSYEFYLETLKNYCRELKLPIIGTHGLRHSTAELYQSHGATRDDLRELFAHSSSEITDRYIHHKGSLDKVARGLRVLPGGQMDQEPIRSSNSDQN